MPNHPPHIDSQLDEIYDTADYMMRRGYWHTLNELFECMTNKVWRTDLNILLGWATATLPGKSKIPNRARFMDECLKHHSDANEPDLWKGLT